MSELPLQSRQRTGPGPSQEQLGRQRLDLGAL